MVGLLTATRAAAGGGRPAPVAALALMRRALATAPGADGAGAAPAKPIEKLKARLADGPSFHDFVAGGKGGAAVDDDADDATPVAPPGRPAKTQYVVGADRGEHVVGCLAEQTVRRSLSTRLCPSVPLPPWLKFKIPTGYNYHRIKGSLRELNLATVRGSLGRLTVRAAAC